MATYSAVIYNASSWLSLTPCYMVKPYGADQFSDYIVLGEVYKAYIGIGTPILNAMAGKEMIYEGKTLTDKWYPVRLMDSTDPTFARPGVAVASVTVTYGFESAVAETPYAIIAADWKEQGNGNYWLNMGAAEFTQQGKYTVKVRTYPIAYDLAFYVEVRDFLVTETIADVPVSNQGTALAGGPSTIQLAVTASGINDTYAGSTISIVSGLGIGQSRICTGYVALGTTATIYPAWQTQPNNTSVYKIIPLGASKVDAVDAALQALAVDNIFDELTTGHNVVNSFGQILNNARANVALAGTPSTIQLDVGASAVNDFYNGNIIFISSGLGVGQARIITAYDGVTKIATIQPNWITNPGALSEYVIIPSSSTSVATIASAILDADLQTHLGVPVGGRNIGNILGQLAQSEFELRTNVFATVAVPAQGIIAIMTRKGVIQYQQVDMSYTKNWAAPDRTFYILYHYNAQQKQDIAKASLGTVW